MKIEFEAYVYDARKVDTGEDPYRISYNVSCGTLEEAAHYAAKDYDDYLEREWDDYGGAVVVVDGKVICNFLRNGDIEYNDKEFKNLFEITLENIPPRAKKSELERLLECKNRAEKQMARWKETRTQK